jgi:hypothetical protein
MKEFCRVPERACAIAAVVLMPSYQVPSTRGIRVVPTSVINASSPIVRHARSDTTGRTAVFATKEVTAPSVDVSPDGRTLVFDLLGDLYLVPIGGGRAIALTHGTAWNSEPKFSPDGRNVVFVSDSSGSSNLWRLDIRTHRWVEITKDTSVAYADPVITPDGSTVIVARAERGTHGAYDLWATSIRPEFSSVRYPLTRANAPNIRRVISQRERLAMSRLEPTISRASGTVFCLTGTLREYAGSWSVKAVTLSGDSIPYGIPLPSDSGLASRVLRPVVSPDGRYLVYERWRDTTTQWHSLDLVTGADTPLTPLESARAAQTASTTTTGPDLAQGVAFTPDSRALVIGYRGGLWRVEVPSGRMMRIPFVAVVNRRLAPLARFRHHIGDDSVDVRQIIDARPSPNGHLLAFSALNRVYVMQLPHGSPHRLTHDSVAEFEPAWSPDSHTLAYVTWTDTTGGDIRLMNLDTRGFGRGPPSRVQAPLGMYTGLTYSLDGNLLLAGYTPYKHALAESGYPPAVAQIDSSIPGWDSIQLLVTDTHHHIVTTRGTLLPRSWEPATELVTGLTGPIVQSRNSRGLFFARSGELLYRPWEGGPSHTTLSVLDGLEVAMSPDMRFTLASGQIGVFVIRPDVGFDSVLTLGLTDSIGIHGRLLKIDATQGDWLGWFPNRLRIYYSRGPVFYTFDLTTRRKTADTIRLRIPRDVPGSTIVLRRARLITMRGCEVIERGDIVVRHNRIESFGPSGSIRIPAGVRTIDLLGMTIMPGWIDVHHHVYSRWSRFRSQPWQYLSDLSFGVTTVRDPLNPIQMLTYADRGDAGDLLGPRLYTTGLATGLTTSLTGERAEFTSSDAALSVLRYFSANRTETIKQELMPGDQYLADMNRLEQRAYIAAALQLRLTPTVHETEFREDMSLMLDGYAGHEHSYPVNGVYDDVVRLSAVSGLVYTQTLGAEYGWSQFIYASPFESDQRVARFMPPVARDTLLSLAKRTIRDDGAPIVARQGATIARGGGVVALGSHGNYAGPGVHWELWALASGGMSACEVLRAGTINGAYALGHEEDLGSIDVGKLADLQVLERNPLVDIHNSWSTKYVMKGGRLYDAVTLDQVYPAAQRLSHQWWQQAH